MMPRLMTMAMKIRSSIPHFRRVWRNVALLVDSDVLGSRAHLSGDGLYILR